MTITIDIPEHVSPDAAHRAQVEAREAAAVRLYRDGELTRGQVATLLGIDREDVDEVITRHGVGMLNGVTAQDIVQEADAIRRLREGRR